MNKVKLLRMLRGMTQIQIWRLTNIWPSRLSLIENGWVEPSQAEKEKLARAIEAPIEELFNQGDKACASMDDVIGR